MVEAAGIEPATGGAKSGQIGSSVGQDASQVGHGHRTSTLNWDTFSQVTFAFDVTAALREA